MSTLDSMLRRYSKMGPQLPIRGHMDRHTLVSLCIWSPLTIILVSLAVRGPDGRIYRFVSVPSKLMYVVIWSEVDHRSVSSWMTQWSWPCSCWLDDSLSVSRLANGNGKASFRSIVEIWQPCAHEGSNGSPCVRFVIYGQNVTILIVRVHVRGPNGLILSSGATQVVICPSFRSNVACRS